MNYKEIYNDWISNPNFDKETKAELLKLKENDAEIEDRFYCELEFGTAGLRGVIGAGTNRMNIYTVRKATQGLANYIIKQGQQSRGVAIAYDCRNMSPEFAEETALCLAANGIKAHVFESLRPIPELSFTVLHLGCIAGVTITASHNPPEYNGYKVTWEDGAQLTDPHDTGVMEEVASIPDYSLVKTIDKKSAIESGLYITIGKEIDDAYIAALKTHITNPEILKYAKDLNIVYTPLNGTGNILVRRLLSEIGFDNIHVVPEQEAPDGNFPTLKSPNPEVPEAFEYALSLAKKIDSDLIIGTDPDADRLRSIC